MADHLIPATIIGSWSFPGWFEKFVADVTAERARYRCVATLEAPRGLGIVPEYRRLREYTAAPVKMPVPGPFTLAGCLDGGAVYPGRDAVTAALIPIVNAELQALAAAGVDFIQ